MAIRACQTIQASNALFDPFYRNTDTICVTDGTEDLAVSKLNSLVNKVSNFCGGGAIPLTGTGSTCSDSTIVLEKISTFTSLFYYAWDSYNFVRTSDTIYFLF